MVEKRNILPTAVLTTFGVGFLYIVMRNRMEIIRRIKSVINFRNSRQPSQIEVVNSMEECEQVVNNLKKHCAEYRVLGFDCEWVAVGGSRRPIALLQLASHRGMCALIRLCSLRRVPSGLRDLLEDESILKVGVAPQEDARYLSNDYAVGIASTFDLRYLAVQVGEKPEGLAKMSSTVLNIQLDKDWRIRCSDWETRILTERQTNYAANDAFVAIELFKELSRKVKTKFWQRKNETLEEIISTCEPFIDIRFRERLIAGFGPNQKNVGILRKKPITTKKDITRNMSTRSRRLYDNCYLEAPDGETLCTCDKKKAEWYVDQNLGEMVKSDPFTVRLNFEPAGRAVGEVGKYYTLVKENRCVVCGKEDAYIRKNVVPREYRKHFPVVMKSHTSHDVLLLCPCCHQLSNISDLKIREKLSEMCNAPLTSEDGGKKVIEIPRLRQLKSAARALLYSGKSIPVDRKDILKKIVLDNYPPGTELTISLLEEAALIDTVEYTKNYCSHGLKVVQNFTEKFGGLIELEKMWREHFLNTMRPQFLPDLWSITHNANRLEIRVYEGRIEKDDIIVAGLNPSPLDNSSEILKENSMNTNLSSEKINS